MMQAKFRGLVRRRRYRQFAGTMWRVFFGASLLALVFFALSWFSFYAPFQIAQVTLVGINRAARDERLAAEAEVAHAFAGQGVRLFSFTHKLFYPRAALTAAVASSSPRIASATAMRGGAIVIVAVSERKPFATWCADNGCLFIDTEGFGFTPAKGDSPPTSSITFYGGMPLAGARYLPEGRFTILREVLAAAERVGLSVEKVARGDGSDVSFTLANGAEARFVLSPEAAALFLELPATLAAAHLRIADGSVSPPLQYLDLRFRDQVVFKRK